MEALRIFDAHIIYDSANELLIVETIKCLFQENIGGIGLQVLKKKTTECPMITSILSEPSKTKILSAVLQIFKGKNCLIPWLKPMQY